MRCIAHLTRLDVRSRVECAVSRLPSLFSSRTSTSTSTSTSTATSMIPFDKGQIRLPHPTRFVQLLSYMMLFHHVHAETPLGIPTQVRRRSDAGPIRTFSPESDKVAYVFISSRPIPPPSLAHHRGPTWWPNMVAQHGGIAHKPPKETPARC